MYRLSVTISRIGGVPVRLHWSWMLAIAYLAVTLSQLYLLYAGESWALGMALAAVLLLFLSLMLHELGHALVARVYGVSIRSITLFVFGGMTDISDEAVTPLQELQIALAGPLVSLALAGLWGALWWAGGWSPVGLLALPLALANGMIALFHLLPGYPMDGGRALRAVLWFLTDEDLPSARLAERIGRICGWLLIGIGVVYGFSAGDLISGLLIALVGGFVVHTAASGYGQLLIRRALSGVRTGDVMQRAYRAVHPDLRLDHFVGRYLLGQIEQGYPVLNRPDDEGPQPLLGMISARNLRRFGLDAWNTTYVQQAMTPAHRLQALAPDTPAGDAFRAMVESGEEQLPVMDGETLAGVLRRRDLMRYIQVRAARMSAGK